MAEIPDFIKGAGAKESFRLADIIAQPKFSMLGIKPPVAQGPAPAQPAVTANPSVAQPATQTATQPAQPAVPSVIADAAKPSSINFNTLSKDQIAKIEKNNPKLLDAAPEELRRTATMSAQERTNSGLPENPTQDELLARYFDSTDYALAKEELDLTTITNEADAAAAKDSLEAKYEGDRVELEQNLAQNGLAFSGVRNTQVAALAESLAASKLGEDRKLAKVLLNADMNFKKTILKGVAEVAADAAKGRQEAIDQLNKAGFAMVNGQLVPTLAAQTEKRLAAVAALPRTQIATVGGQVRLINKDTGETIKVLGASSGGSTKKPLTYETWAKTFKANPLIAPFIGNASMEEVIGAFSSESAPAAFAAQFADPDPISVIAGTAGVRNQKSASQIQAAWEKSRASVLNSLTGATENTVTERFSDSDRSTVQAYTGMSFAQIDKMSPEEFNNTLQEAKAQEDDGSLEAEIERWRNAGQD